MVVAVDNEYHHLRSETELQKFSFAFSPASNFNRLIVQKVCVLQLV